MPFPTTSLLDDFNRADGAVGASWTGPIWGDAALNVASNQCVSASGAGSLTWASQFGTDLEVWCKVAVPPAAASGHSLRLPFWTTSTGATPDGYCLRMIENGAASFLIVRIDDGVETTIATLTTITCASGDYIGFEKIGTTYTGYYKPAAGSWSSKGSVVSATYSPTWIGLSPGEASPLAVDDFAGGAVVAGVEASVVGQSDVLRKRARWGR